MNIALLLINSNRKGLVNKDVSGGMGTMSYFGNSVVGKLLTFLKKQGISYPPLSMGYLASILRSRGHKVRVYVDTIPENVELVVIHSSIVDYKNEIEFVKKIKYRTKAKVCMIGPFSMVKPDIFLSYVDFIIKGEPEAFFINFYDSSEIPEGIVDAGIVKDLDDLPFPDWSVFPMDKFKYKPYFIFSKGRRFFPILTSRGCPLSCGYYCPYPIIAGKQWRTRSVNNIVNEIEFLVKEMNAGFLLFRDPIFTLKRNRTVQIATEIIRRRINIEYVCETHLSYLDESLIDLLYDSGLRAIKVGIESPEERVLKNVKRKRDNIKHQERILKYCEKKKIAVTAFYILGLPEDTVVSVLNTVKYAIQLNTIGAQFTVFTPYPGTESFVELDKQRLITDYDFEHYNIYTLVYKHKNISKDQMIKLQNYAYNRYYLRLDWLLKFLKFKIFS